MTIKIKPFVSFPDIWTNLFYPFKLAPLIKIGTSYCLSRKGNGDSSGTKIVYILVISHKLTQSFMLQ